MIFFSQTVSEFCNIHSQSDNHSRHDNNKSLNNVSAYLIGYIPTFFLKLSGLFLSWYKTMLLYFLENGIEIYVLL